MCKQSMVKNLNPSRSHIQVLAHQWCRCTYITVNLPMSHDLGDSSPHLYFVFFFFFIHNILYSVFKYRELFQMLEFLHETLKYSSITNKYIINKKILTIICQHNHNGFNKSIPNFDCPYQYQYHTPWVKNHPNL